MNQLFKMIIYVVYCGDNNILLFGKKDNDTNWHRRSKWRVGKEDKATSSERKQENSKPFKFIPLHEW